MNRTRPIKFGVHITPIGRSFDWIKSVAQEADKDGFHCITFFDHFYYPGVEQLPVLEAWTLITATAVVTERLRIGSLVLCNSYRHPALLAKMVASLDAMTGGRVEFAIGAGGFQFEYEAYGYPYPKPSIRIGQLEETIQILKKMWTEERPTFEGKYYSIKEAVNVPKPVQKPHPPFHIGGFGEKLMLRLVAKYADIWNGGDQDPEIYPHKIEVLKEHCKAVGRDFDEIELSSGYTILIGATEKEVKEKLDLHMERGARGNIGIPTGLSRDEFVKRHIVGTPDQIIERIQEIIQAGPTFILLTIPDVSRLEPLKLFSEKVMPAFRG